MSLKLEKKEFIQLLDVYLSGEATPEQEKMVINYYNSFEEAEWDHDAMGDEQVREEDIYDLLKGLLNTEKRTAPRRIYFLKTAWFRYAAIVILFSGVGFYLWFHAGFNKKTETIQQTAKLPANILPGGNKAVLTLADGSTIVLDSASIGTVASQGNTRILKPDAGSIAYKGKGHANDIGFNTVTTPKGGQYQIVLADGTHVWLNASSGITYPTAFSGKDRTVSVTGEVYLEVARNKNQPFAVHAGGALIKVLGTGFNINAYADEGSIKTTLIEGSVAVGSGAKEAILLPGQQAEIKQENIAVNLLDKAGLDKALAWKNGLFNFEGSGLPELMLQLERWYDVNVIYEGRIPTEKFQGEMYRNVPLSDVLKVLNKMGIRLRLEGRNLIVQGK